MQRIDQQLAFIVEIDKLKNILRQNTLCDITRRENDAEHSWHLAMAALVLQEHALRPADISRTLQLALVHDLVEIDAGDTFAYDAVGYESKEAREKAAAERIFGLLPADQRDHIRGLWDEFEARETPEAALAVAMDRLVPFLHNFTAKGGTWIRHGVRKQQVLTRMQPIYEATPALWPEILRRIDIAVAEGFLKE